MSSQEVHATYRDRLAGSALPVYDGGIDLLTITDPDYLVLYDETRPVYGGRYAWASTEQQVTLRVMCVSRTRDGVRRVVDACRARYVDWAPDRYTVPLTEEQSGPILRDTQATDVRYTVTLYYRTTTPWEAS